MMKACLFNTYVMHRREFYKIIFISVARFFAWKKLDLNFHRNDRLKISVYLNYIKQLFVYNIFLRY